MLLESLEVHDWRNLSGRVDWGSNLNIIYGDNGQGKTNWLEAIYLLATTKSFRTQRLQEALRFDQKVGLVKGRVTRTENFYRDLQVTIEGTNKRLSVNGKRETVSRYLDQLHAVAFTAEEMEVVRGGPEARRKFLDRGAIALQSSYLTVLSSYNRVIKQKNKLLQDAASAEWSFEETYERLHPWNEQLISLAVNIHQARVAYVAELNQSLYKNLFRNEVITTRYASALEGKGDLNDYESLIRERLELRAQAEFSAGYSLIGPHRDDLEILFDGRNIRTFGSSGQQRSALILLDLSAIEVYYRWHKERPIFLADDLDAELDGKRLDLLIEHLNGRTQTFITTTNESLVERYRSYSSVFRVSGGASQQVVHKAH